MKEVETAVIYIAKEYKPWQQAILNYCKTVPLNDTQTGPADPKGWVKELRGEDFFKTFTKDENKKAMPFAAFVMNDEMAARGTEALDLQLSFDEHRVVH